MLPLKHPAFRYDSYAKIDRAILLDFYNGLKTWGSLTPFAHLIEDFYGVGSYACESALIYSDPDVSVAFHSPEDFITARTMFKTMQTDMEMQRKWREARAYWITEMLRKYEVHTEIAVQDWDVTQSTNKSYFSFKEMKLYKRDIKVKNRIRPPFREIVVKDDNDPNGIRPYDPTRDTPEMYDKWLTEIPKFNKQAGYQVIGQTADTNWITNGRPTFPTIRT